MKNFSDFVQYFNETPVEDIPAVAAQVLTRAENWCGIVSDYIAELSDTEFCQNVLRAYVACVEPKVFLLYEQPGKFQIVLHHFDLRAFNAYWKAGFLGPHYHHFPFSTRLLQGSYYNWIYDNHGNLQQPELKLALQAKCQTGDVYTLPYDRFHCVLMPQNDTMTLMVRGKAVANPGHRKSKRPLGPSCKEALVLKMRSRLLKLLGDPPQPQPGQLVSFQQV